MIKTTAQRNTKSIERLHYHSSNQTLQNVITEGTSCSPFEASIISENAEEILCVGKYSQENMCWFTVNRTFGLLKLDTNPSMFM
jgi:hypothetical protein